jgi:hypothetical protein
MRRVSVLCGLAAIAIWAACSDAPTGNTTADMAVTIPADMAQAPRDLSTPPDLTPAATCTDGIKNGMETDKDCGGGCPACMIGQSCGGNADCAMSAVCDLSNLSCRTPKTAAELRAAKPTTPDGVYTFDPDGAGAVAPIDLYVDMTTDGGGWMLVLKTDMSNNMHNLGTAVNVAGLKTLALDSVAKLDDSVIRALQTASGTGTELRIETPDFTAKYFARGTGGFSLPKPANYGRDIEARLTGGNYKTGMQCYDGEHTMCAADHFCLSTGPVPGNNVEHMCVRRFSASGLWFNTGVFAPGAYHKGRIWVR